MTKGEPNSECLKCGYKWKSKWSPDTLPLRTQCPHCWGFSVVLIETYKAHLQQLRKIFTPEEIKKFQQFYDWTIQNGYVRNPSTREAKLRRLMEDLANPEPSVG